MRRQFIAVLAPCFVLILLLASFPAFASPPYAVSGAFASYTAQGGFIPYFSGVEGTLNYTITSVFTNGTMALSVFENITAGTDLNPFIYVLNITDSVQNPRNFPIVPIAEMASHSVVFQNVSIDFVKNETTSVPAGEFNTMKFSGYGANDTTYEFWFDASTGLMIEASSATSVMELDSTNIATPTGTPGFFSSEGSYELVFIGAFAIGGFLFWYVRYHYTRSAAAKAEKASRRG